jgi:hypothetical protein
MPNCLISMGVILPLLVHAPAPEKKTEPPKGPAPELRWVSGVDREKAVVMITMMEYLPVEKEVTVNVNVGGKIVVEKRKIIEFIKAASEISFDLNDNQMSATDVLGKKLTKDGVLALLTPGKVIALTRDGNGIDPAFRAALARDLLILIVPWPDSVPPIPKTKN